MSASNRKLSRLPLRVFQDLITRPPDGSGHEEPQKLKSAICNRLKRFPVRINGRTGKTSTILCVKTIGQLLRLSRYSLLLALDPILTYEEIGIFLDRVCFQCAPKPINALALLQRTMDEDGLQKKLEQIMQDEPNDPGSCCNLVAFGTSMRCLPTGLASLNDILRGGIRLGTVTEVVGRSGVAKTQLALQLCVMAAKYNQGAIYIDTEGKVSIARLREMSNQWRKRATTPGLTSNSRSGASQMDNFDFTYNQQHSSTAPTQMTQQYPSLSEASQNNEESIGSYKTDGRVLANLTVHHPSSTEELLHVLGALEEEILHRNEAALQASTEHEDEEGLPRADADCGKYPVRLLVVDSIASPMRRDFGTDSAPQRAAAIFQCAQTLKRLADQCHLAVVVINQVGTSDRDDTNNSSHGKLGGSDQVKESMGDQVSTTAALGTSWHHCVSTRLLMESTTMMASNPPPRDMDGEENHPNFSRWSPPPSYQVVRTISIVKSNLTDFAKTHFQVSSLGLLEFSPMGSQKDHEERESSRS